MKITSVGVFFWNANLFELIDPREHADRLEWKMHEAKKDYDDFVRAMDEYAQMKKCKCGKPARIGQRYCRACHAEYMRNWRKNVSHETQKN